MAEETVKKPTKVTAKAVDSEKKAQKTEKAAAPVVKKSISLEVYGLDGKVTKMSVSAEMFGAAVNKQLLAQAVRVYLANQRQGTVSTKTRGEVEGSTRKIYRQKGTGRARHGSVRAPIFVKGGVVFGPKPRDYSLSLTKKMKRKALFSALSQKVSDKALVVVSGFSALDPKTKQFVAALSKLPVEQTKTSILVVVPAKAENVIRAVRNIPGVSYISANKINTYAVLQKKKVLVMQEAVSELEKIFLGKE